MSELIAKTVAGALAVTVAGIGIWQLNLSEPMLPPALLGAALLLFGLLLGIRVGYEGMRAFALAADRMNRHLVEQCNRLVEQNSWLLEQLGWSKTTVEDPTPVPQQQDDDEPAA